MSFRKHTLLPLDDCLYALHATIPALTRCSQHRVSSPWNQPPARSGRGQAKRKKFDSYPIVFFHIDLDEVRTAKGRLYLFVAIDRTSKFAFVELLERADIRAASSFLEALLHAVPYRIHSMLTDNGTNAGTKHLVGVIKLDHFGDYQIVSAPIPKIQH